MPKAGYCAQCETNVWLREDGSCERGHPAASVSGHYDAPAPAETVVPSAQATTPKPRRRAIVVAGAIVAAVIVIALVGVGAAAALRPLANKGSAVASEWNARLAQDYPGWKTVGFNVNSFAGSGGSETTYAFSLIPPGRNFPVSVSYESSGGAQPVSQDEVLRVGARFSDRSASLLDYIDANYVRKGRDIASVTSDPNGDVTVTWRKVSRFLLFTWTTGSFDDLTYNEDTHAWSVSFSPGN